MRLVRVDIAELVEPRSFDLLVPAQPGVEVPDGFDERSIPSTRMLGVWFDRRTALLQPLVHRQALQLLLDPPVLAGLALDADEVPSCVGWLPGVGRWCELAGTPFPMPDRDLGAYLLFDQGWLRADESGVLSRRRESFEIPLSYDPAVPGATAVAGAIREAFAEIGVGVAVAEVSSDAWAALRGADSPTGVGVFAFDLGVTAGVDRLYGCPVGLDSSVMAWCAPEVVDPARALQAEVGPDARGALVRRIGGVAAADVAWIPLGTLPVTSFVRAGRVTLPSSRSVLGGPLADLEAFSVDGWAGHTRLGRRTRLGGGGVRW